MNIEKSFTEFSKIDLFLISQLDEQKFKIQNLTFKI